jgi:hypothetical protein
VHHLIFGQHSNNPISLDYWGLIDTSIVEDTQGF